VTQTVLHAAEVLEPPSTCGQCGAALRGDARFCVTCGAAVAAAAVPTATVPVVALPVPAPSVAVVPAAAAEVPAAAAEVVVVGSPEVPRQQRPAPWAPTHRTASPGQPLWAEPDADGQPTGKLAAGLEVQVTRVWGAWAQIRLANGWVGWVDHRRLIPC
jgi:hypothetical protein